MNSSRFRSTVRFKAPKTILSAAIEAAITECIEERGVEGQYTDQDVSRAIQMASRLAPLMMSVRDESKVATKTEVSAKGREFIDTDTACDALEPKVREIRTRLFRSADPPFPGTPADPWANARKALEWIQQAGKINPPSFEIARERALLRELSNLKLCEVRYDYRFVPFPGLDGPFISNTQALLGTPLYELSDDVRRLSLGGLFHEASITLWLMTGIRPLISRVRLQRTQLLQGEQGLPVPPRTSVTVTINASDLSWDELLKIYRSIRSDVNAKRQKVNDLHSEIYRVVRERGGPPTAHGEKEKFWKSILAQLKKDKRFTARVSSVPQIRKAYNELSKGVK